MASRPLLGDGGQVIDPAIDALHERIDELQTRVARLSEEMDASRQQIKRDAVITVLNLLGQSLRHVASGQMDIPEPATVHSGVENLDRWTAIKQRFGNGSNEAELIDVLLTAGPRTNTQLKGLLKLAYSTVAALTLKMSNLGFITKQGESWALKP